MGLGEKRKIHAWSIHFHLGIFHSHRSYQKKKKKIADFLKCNLRVSLIIINVVISADKLHL